MTTAKKGTFAAIRSDPIPNPVLITRATKAPWPPPSASRMSTPAAASSPRATGSIVSANFESGLIVMSARANVLSAPFGRFSVTSSLTASPYSAYPAPPMTRHVANTIAYVASSIGSYSSGVSMLA